MLHVFGGREFADWRHTMPEAAVEDAKAIVELHGDGGKLKAAL